jgi:SAM-dependent methyltransferase
MGRQLPAAWYDEVFASNDGWQGPVEGMRLYPVWRKVCDAVVRLQPTAVLDVGCGPGHLGTLLARSSMPEGFTYLGMDFSDEALRQGYRRFRRNRSFSFRKVDLTSIMILRSWSRYRRARVWCSQCPIVGANVMFDGLPMRRR